MSSNWDRQWVGDDGEIRGSYYIAAVDYAHAYELYSREPVGNKYDMQVAVYRIKQKFVAHVDGRYLADVPITWNRLSAGIAEGQGVWAQGHLTWKTPRNGDPYFIFNVDIRIASPA